MSKVCEMMREMIKDEKKAPSDYEKLKVKMLGHPNIKKLYDEMKKDEERHYKTNLKIAEKFGCDCSKS